MTETPNGDVLLSGLRAADSVARLQAVRQLAALPVPGADLLAALETLALSDPDLSIRRAALSALASPGVIQARRAQGLPQNLRIEILTGIDRWLLHDMLTSQQAEVLRLRYHYDLPPLRISLTGRTALIGELASWQQQGLLGVEQAADLQRSLGIPAESKTEAPPAHADEAPAAGSDAPEAAPALGGSALQVLFSEVSIRIALYLGGFLIVAAMLILAALVEVARLPILLGMTAISGAAAGVLRKRLALPAFVIFLVFASLLPIDARILIEQSGIHSDQSYAWWVLTWAVVAQVFWWGTWLYRSRLFSLLALAALVAAGWMLAFWSGEKGELFFLFTLLAALFGLLGSWQLSRRLSGSERWRFAAPLFWSAQGVASLVVLAGLLSVTGLSFDAPAPELSIWWGFSATWFSAVVFYVISDRWIKPLRVFPFLTAGSLILMLWSVISAFDLPHIWRVAGLAAAGLLYTAAAAWLDREPKRMSYAARFRFPLWIGAVLLLSWSALAGLDWSGPPFFLDQAGGNWPAFLVLALTVVTYSLLHAQRYRPALWFVALSAGVLAYLTLFHLPFARGWQIDMAYRLLLPGLVLLLPELIRGPERDYGRAWTVMARWFGTALLALNTLMILVIATLHALARFIDPDIFVNELPWLAYALAFTLAGLACLAWSLRWRRPRLAYGLAGYFGLGLAFWLLYLGWTAWALPLAGLAALFYATSFLPMVISAGPDWPDVFRRSGLALGAAVVLRLPYEPGAQPGFALLGAGLLFLSELLATRRWRLEWPLYLLLVLSFLRLLVEFLPGASAINYGLLGAALIVLGFDLFFTWRYRTERAQRPAPAVLGGLIVLAHVLYLVMEAGLARNEPAYVATWIFLFYSGFFLLAAWIYRMALLGALPLGFLALALLFGLRAVDSTQWVAPLVGLAGFYYLLSFVLQQFWRPADGLKYVGWEVGWITVLRHGGLVLAALAALSAPLEQLLVASIPVAAAATLWALDAFRRRNVWLGFPANGLYLLAYFIILLELRVDQPQYFSTGVALLGLVMHILLVRSGSAPGASLGAFVTGMVSQLVLLGTTYIQMVSTNELGYFIMLFFQGLLVLAYGVFIRSRSLVFTPLVFVILGVITVVLSVLSGVPTAIIIGCTGFFLLAAGIAAVVMRERLLRAEDRLGGWRA